MTIHTNRQVPSTTAGLRRPQFPLEQNAGSLFVGWGPRI